MAGCLLAEDELLLRTSTDELKDMYEYQATLIQAIDGDTVDLDIDLGLDIHHRIRVRIEGVDTPELHSSDASERAQALLAKQFTEDFLSKGAFIIRTFKDRKEKYGRYLVSAYVGNDNLGAALIAKGLAVPYSGGKR